MIIEVAFALKKLFKESEIFVNMTKITFLGTSDQIPSRGRNHTSILLTEEGENILIDCGEGTQRQFRKANLNPCKIDKILITHWHGDHVLGLPGLLSTLALSGYNKNLEIYCPKGIKEKIEGFLEIFSFRREYKIKIKEILTGKFFENDDFLLESEEMEHGVKCLAYSFTKKGKRRIDKGKLKKSGIKGPILKNLSLGEDIEFEGKKYKSKEMTYVEENKKISIVLDTKFNDKISPFIKNSNVLICESTYSKDLSKEAEDHLHLTNEQAAKLAKKSKVEKLFLVHVSSRYIKDFKTFLNESKEIFKGTFLPRDLESFEI